MTDNKDIKHPIKECDGKVVDGGSTQYQEHFRQVDPREWDKIKEIYQNSPKFHSLDISINQVVIQIFKRLGVSSKTIKIHADCNNSQCRVFSTVYKYVSKARGQNLCIDSNENLILKNIHDHQLQSKKQNQQGPQQCINENKKKENFIQADFESFFLDKISDQDISSSERNFDEFQDGFNQEKADKNKHDFQQDKNNQMNQGDQNLQSINQTQKRKYLQTPIKIKLPLNNPLSTMKKQFGIRAQQYQTLSAKGGLLCSDLSFAENDIIKSGLSVSADKQENYKSQFSQLQFLNNIKSTENWTKGKNIQQKRYLGKRTHNDRTKDILQSLAARAGTSLDEIVGMREEIAIRQKELQSLKTLYSSRVRKFCNILQDHDQV